jgi:cyclase
MIPRLDIKGPNLVKGIHLEGLRAIGPPEYFARYYYQNGADELVYMDSVASLYGTNSLTEIIAKMSREIFIPLCVGGGIRCIEDINRILSVGADKVSINTAAHADPSFISKAANIFGKSTIVVAIEAMKSSNNKYQCFTSNGREPTGISPFEWAKRAEELGAGELMVTSINQEGTGQGFDYELTKRISESVKIPVIACGGAGSYVHIEKVIKEGMADAVSVASMFHYHVKKNISVPNAENYGIGQHANRINKIHVETIGIRELKDRLFSNGIQVRRVV